MDNKEYRYIPIALFDAITFLCQSLPKRSVPTFLELLFGAMLTQTGFATDAVLAVHSGFMEPKVWYIRTPKIAD
jgi:hypothetical protein